MLEAAGEGLTWVLLYAVPFGIAWWLDRRVK